MAKEDCLVVAIPKPKKRPKSRAARKKRDGRHCPERLAVLSKMPCSVSGIYGVNVHHAHEGGEPPDDFKTIPILYEYHQGAFCGIHSIGRKNWERRYGSLESHLTKTNALLIEAGLERLVKK